MEELFAADRGERKSGNVRHTVKLFKFQASHQVHNDTPRPLYCDTARQK